MLFIDALSSSLTGDVLQTAPTAGEITKTGRIAMAGKVSFRRAATVAIRVPPSVMALPTVPSVPVNAR